jgi:hypothetical protein
MSTPIQIIPRIQSLELEAIDCWDSLHLEFSPGLNIITGGLGKTTILASIMSEVCPHNDMGLVAPPLVSGKSRIAVQLMPSAGTARDVACGEIPPQTDKESHGQYMMRFLESCLAMAEDSAVLFDEDVLGRLDSPNYSKAVKWLNASTTQVICVVKHLNRTDFPKARIFTCSWDGDKGMSRMSRLQ